MIQNWWLDYLFRSLKACVLLGWWIERQDNPHHHHMPPSLRSRHHHGNERRPPPIVHETDVLVVGAGAAGWSAAHTLHEKIPSDDWKVTILESRDTVGGRVQSFAFHNRTLQRGANWIFSDSTAGELFWDAGLEACPDDYLNASVYKIECSSSEADADGRRDDRSHRALRSLAHHRHYHDTGLPHLDANECTARLASQARKQSHIDKFKERVIPCIDEDTEGIWDDEVVDDDFVDIGLQKAFRRCGWNKDNPLDDWLKWVWQDYEFATRDGSLYAWVDSVADQPYFVKDDWSGDWERRFDELIATGRVDLHLQRRVTEVRYDLHGYDEDDDSKPHVRAKVTAVDAVTGRLHVYVARRVILTVSTGVYDDRAIRFDPPLRYSDARYNPMRIEQYVKIFYHFPARFWTDEEEDDDVDYIFTVDKSHDDQVRSWQNLDRPDLYPGSRMLLLTLTTEGLEQVLGEDLRQDLSQEVLSALTEPLQITFGDAFVPHDDVVYNRFHQDPDFGYGAYSQWKRGMSVEDYFRFWGGYDNGEYVKPCHHNGCNDDDEWILYLSGTTMCLENWEMVTGALDGGAFTANLVMESLGLDIGDWTQRCYV